MSETWTVLRLLRWTADFFREHDIAAARLDAELLLAHVLGCARIELYLAFDEPVSPADRARLRELVRRRAKQRVPVAYLTGTREFWSLPLSVTPDVLIPRPDTETLVRICAQLGVRHIADVGTGTGCVAIALARELPQASLIGVDVSEAALAVAGQNAAAAGVADRLELRHGDLLCGLDTRFELIASNPPYVPTSDLVRLSPEVQQEPRVALDGGSDGLDVLRRLIAQAPEHLEAGGYLALEVGSGQAGVVSELVGAAGADTVETHRDLAGIERVVLGRFGA